MRPSMREEIALKPIFNNPYQIIITNSPDSLCNLGKQSILFLLI